MTFNYRPYQVDCATQIATDMIRLRKIGVILPTGAGKSEIFIKVTDDFLAKNPDKSVLVLSHLSLLTDQTSERFKLRAPHLKVSIMQADQLSTYDSRVVVSTMQSSRDADKIERFKRESMFKVGLVIVDECHYLQTESYDKALGFFPDAKILGVTATPFRERQLMTNYFEKISFSISLQDLISQGFLVPPKLLAYRIDNDSTEERMATVAQLYRDHEMGKKAIIFMRTIEDAKTMRNVLVNMGVNARAVTSDLTGENRDEVLGEFRDGDTDVLTTVNVLTAGFDAPCTEAIFMPYTTDSPTLYMQRIGRGLRPYKDKKECRVYVMGDAPSISSKLFEKIHRHALNGTTEWKEHSTYAQDLEFNVPDRDSMEMYQWAASVVDVVKKLDTLGLPGMARMLNEKSFPRKLMGKLDLIAEKLTAVASEEKSNSSPSTACTQKQTDALVNWGFGREESSQLNKHEASLVLSAMTQLAQAGGPLVVKSGKFAGKHVSQLPWAYQNIVLQKFPKSAIAEQIREFQKQRRA